MRDAGRAIDSAAAAAAAAAKPLCYSYNTIARRCRGLNYGEDRTHSQNMRMRNANENFRQKFSHIFPQRVFEI